jgi:hypothetical protein
LNQENPDLYEFELSGGGGHYTLDWPELNISFKVNRIKESTDHEVKGEVMVVSQRPTSAGHLRYGRLNLTSPSARNSFAKSLAARDSSVDWDQCMEQMCVAVIGDWRSGVPLTQITGDVDVKAQAKWLIEPVIQANNPTLIYGPGASGKSWLAVYLAVLCDAHLHHGGLTVEPSKVLYLDWETDEMEIGTRVTMIRNGLGLEGKSGIWYKQMTQGLSADIETVRTICLEKNIDLVVVDSMGAACAGEPESAEVVLRAFSSLRSLNTSSLLIDHTNKENVSSQSTNPSNLFGSVYKANASRIVMEVHREAGHRTGDAMSVGLFMKKANNIKLRPPLGFELRFTDDSVHIERQDVKDTPLEEHMRVQDRIANLLTNRIGGLSPAVIAEELSKSESHIRKELSNGKQAGRFTILGNGKYANRSWEEEESWRL